MKRLSLVVGLVACLGFCGITKAGLVDITWRGLEDADSSGAFYGRSPGADLFWGTSDDQITPTENLVGAASYGYNTLDPYGPIGGFSGVETNLRIQTRFDTSDGSYEFRAYDYGLIWNWPALGFVNSSGGPFTLIENGSSNSGSQSSDQTGTYQADLLDALQGNAFRVNATTYTVFRGDLLSSLLPAFGADVITHFEYIFSSNALPADWQAVQLNQFSWEVTDGWLIPFGGLTAETVFYTASDVSAVPEPTTLALMALGIAGIGYSRRKGEAV